MTKKLVSFDDQAEPGEGLPAAVKAELSATYRPLGEPPAYLDTYTGFFAGEKVWVPGQTSATTTLTAAVSAGATVLPVASGATMPDGTALVVHPGTDEQQILTVTAGGGTVSLTISPGLSAGLASGATIAPLWVDARHFTTQGWSALARWMAKAPVFAGVGSGKITLLGNSWFAFGGSIYETEFAKVHPNATVVNKGVSGNTSGDMLARFDADVPVDSDFVVINEPGVNDMIALQQERQGVTNYEELVAKIRAIGAVPVVLGPPPLSEMPKVAAQRAQLAKALFSVPSTYPSIPASAATLASVTRVEPYSTAIGGGHQQVTTGYLNTAFGVGAGHSLTTGVCTTLIGEGAGRSLTTGQFVTALGQSALMNATGTGCVGVGYGTGQQVTTGGDNTFIGTSAANRAGSTSGNETTTASQQVVIGAYAGLGSATQHDGIVAIGHGATVAGAVGIALGLSAKVTGSNSIALGAWTTVAANQQVGIGDRSLAMSKVASVPQPPADQGVLAVVDNGAGKMQVVARFPTGAHVVLATEA